MIRAIPGVVLALALAHAVTQGSAAAGADDGQTPVASDGSVVPSSESGTARAGLVRPRQGTGPLPGLSSLERVSEPIKNKRSPVATAERAVIGADGRIRINNTSSYPYSAIAEITRIDGSGTWGCTGWFISKDTVATAGHCVHKGRGGTSGFYKPGNITVRPGRNGASTPYGSCKARRLYTVTGWSVDGSKNFDYGAIKLDCSVGKQTGTFGYFHTAKGLTDRPIKIFGYPCDKPSGQMWGMAGSVQASSTYKVRYTIDTFGCQSGSAVYETRNDGPYAMAVHTYYDGGGTNSATRITREVFNNLNNWGAAP